jgi:hypothetical protein
MSAQTRSKNQTAPASAVTRLSAGTARGSNQRARFVARGSAATIREAGFDPVGGARR